MKNIMRKLIQTASPEELDSILKAVVERYRQVFPQWEISVITVEKTRNPNDQINEVIGALEQLKT